MRRATTSHNSEYQPFLPSEGLHVKRTHTSDAEYQDDPQDKSKVHLSPRSATPKGYVGLAGSIPKDGRQNTQQSVLNLVTTILGAGVLGYPYCFKACGMVLATCVMIVSGIACRLSYQLLLYCAHLTNTKSYEDICERSLGKFGRQLVELCNAALNLGTVIAYINILADVLSAVAGTIIPPGAEPSRDAYVAGVALLGVLPVSVVVRDSSIISAFSTASLGLVAVFAVVVTIFALGPNAAMTGPIHVWKPEGLLVAFPVMAYGFTAHPFYLSIYSTLQSPNIKRMTRVTDLAMVVIAVLYWIVGVSGYLSFRHRTAGDLLRNFGAPTVLGLRGAYERGLKLCYGLSILGSVPGVIIPFHRTLDNLLGYNPLASMKSSLSDADLSGKGYHSSSYSRLSQNSTPGDEDLPFVPHMIVCLMVVGVSMASALWVPNVEFIFGLMGATAAVLVAYIIPSISFLRVLGSQPELAPKKNSKAIMVPDEVKWQWRKRKWLAMGLLVFGIVSGIACTDAIISAVHEEAAVVQLAQELVADQAMAAETANVAMKAKEAATTVSAVREAAKGLQMATQNTTATLDTLQSAAAELTRLANSSTHPKSPTASWDLRAKFQEHKQAAADAKVLTNIEADLVAVRRDINSTIHQVLAVVSSMDNAMKQIQKSQSQLEEKPIEPGAVPPATEPVVKVGAEEMAQELAHALGIYANAYNTSAASAKNLEQVRQNAIFAVSALNDTLFVLEHVSLAISLAVASPEHDAKDVRNAAVTAMQKALAAIKTSGLALDMTGSALQHTASAEANQLLKVLTKMVQDANKSKAAANSLQDKSSSKAYNTHGIVTGNSAVVPHQNGQHQDVILSTGPPPTTTVPQDSSTTSTNHNALHDTDKAQAQQTPVGTHSPVQAVEEPPSATRSHHRPSQEGGTASMAERQAIKSGGETRVQQTTDEDAAHKEVESKAGEPVVMAAQSPSGVHTEVPVQPSTAPHQRTEPSSHSTKLPSDSSSQQAGNNATASSQSPAVAATVDQKQESDVANNQPEHNHTTTMTLPSLLGPKPSTSALTPEQMKAVERIINDLENLDHVAIAESPSGQGIDQLLKTNFTALLSAMQSAAQWSAESRETALQKIGSTLSKSHAKVAARVMEFIHDLNKAEEDANDINNGPITPGTGDALANTNAAVGVPTPPPNPAPPQPVKISLRQKVASMKSTLPMDSNSMQTSSNNKVPQSDAASQLTHGSPGAGGIDGSGQQAAHIATDDGQLSAATPARAAEHGKADVKQGSLEAAEQQHGVRAEVGSAVGATQHRTETSPDSSGTRGEKGTAQTTSDGMKDAEHKTSNDKRPQAGNIPVGVNVKGSLLAGQVRTRNLPVAKSRREDLAHLETHVGERTESEHIRDDQVLSEVNMRASKSGGNRPGVMGGIGVKSTSSRGGSGKVGWAATDSRKQMTEGRIPAEPGRKGPT